MNESPGLWWLFGTIIVYLCGAIITTIAAGATVDWIVSVMQAWRMHRETQRKARQE